MTKHLRSFRPECETMEDRLVLSTTLSNHLVAAALLANKAKPKPVPPSFTATATGQTQVNLSWAKVSAATKYLVREIIGGKWHQIASLNAKTTSRAVTGLTTNTAYSFDVGYVKRGRTAWMASKSVRTLTPTKPAAPAWWIHPDSDQQISMGWSAVTGACRLSSCSIHQRNLAGHRHHERYQLRGSQSERLDNIPLQRKAPTTR